MRQKKILYFDYWTVGINQFKLFDHHLRSRGVETKLIHLNSWRKIEGPAHEVIQGIQCFDIRHYQTNSIHQVLKKEMPAAVVMLNLSFVTDRTIILSCRKLNIKTIYLMHGSLTREEFIDESIKSVNQSLKGTRFRRGLGHIKGTVLNYLTSTFKYNKKHIFRIHPYKVLFGTLTNPGAYLHFPPPAFDLKPDLALVYGLGDFTFYTKKLQHDENAVKVVGNPDIDQYFLRIDELGTDKELFLKTHHIPAERPYITYIEEGLVEDRIWENEYRMEFFNEINQACRESGFHLVIKLHPRTARGPYFQSFSQLEKVTVLTQVNFPQLIYWADKCVSHYSTTLIYPILLGKPILVPKWGKSAKLFNLYTEKEVTFVPSIESFKKFIQQNSFHYDRDEYIRSFVPFKDGKTAERIANYIIALMQ